MKLRALFFSLAILLVACSETGPIFATPDALYDWVKSARSLHPDSDRAPLIDDPVVTFHLARGERNSMLRAGHEWGTVQNYLFGFDVRIDPAHPVTQPVTLTRLLRSGQPDAEIVKVTLDPRRGVTVMGRVCIPPAQLATWHSVEIRTSLMDNDTGFLEVYCDRHALWAQSHMRTTLPPVCRRAAGCNTPVPAPVRYEWQVGLMSRAPMRRDTTVEMQRIFYHRLFVIPRRIDTL